MLDLGSEIFVAVEVCGLSDKTGWQIKFEPDTVNDQAYLDAAVAVHDAVAFNVPELKRPLGDEKDLLV